MPSASNRGCPAAVQPLLTGMHVEQSRSHNHAPLRIPKADLHAPSSHNCPQLRLPVCLRLHTAVLSGHGVCAQLALPPSLRVLVLDSVMRDARTLSLATMVSRADGALCWAVAAVTAEADRDDCARINRMCTHARVPLTVRITAATSAHCCCSLSELTPLPLLSPPGAAPAHRGAGHGPTARQPARHGGAAGGGGRALRARTVAGVFGPAGPAAAGAHPGNGAVLE